MLVAHGTQLGNGAPQYLLGLFVVVEAYEGGGFLREAQHRLVGMAQLFFQLVRFLGIGQRLLVIAYGMVYLRGHTQEHRLA